MRRSPPVCYGSETELGMDDSIATDETHNLIAADKVAGTAV